jgi:DNA-binding response OmpR family regulator
MARKVLVVEDEHDTGEILAGLLRRWGFEPTVLQEGKPAIPWVQQHRPDLVLLDLLLPDTHGYSICESLKLERDTNLIPIIMVTCLATPEDRIGGLQVGANRYLTKPFTADELHKTIQEALTAKEDLVRRGTEGMIRFHLQSDTQYLEELNHLLSALFLFSGLDSTQAKQLATAVREMGTNAIEWGHRRQVDRIVTVDYTIDADKITITIRDTGPGFDPEHLPHAAHPEDPIGHLMVRETLGLREGGFGILMARGLVDELQYNDKGNEVRLVKYFPHRNGTEPAGPGEGPRRNGGPAGSEA